MLYFIKQTGVRNTLCLNSLYMSHSFSYSFALRQQCPFVVDICIYSNIPIDISFEETMQKKSIWYRYLPISYEYHNLECYLLDSNENEWNKFCHRFFSWVNDLVKAVHSITFMFRSILISVSLQSIETHFPSPKSSGLYKLIKCIALYSSCMLINVTETLSWWKVFADI